MIDKIDNVVKANQQLEERRTSNASLHSDTEHERYGSARFRLGLWDYLTAGKATFTLYSAKLDKRVTYRVERDRINAGKFFVKRLYGPENNHDYRLFAILLLHDTKLFPVKGSFSQSTDHYRMFSYFLKIAEDPATDWPETCHFYPSGRCARCGRLLTTPESIERGLGPECATRRV